MLDFFRKVWYNIDVEITKFQYNIDMKGESYERKTQNSRILPYFCR